MIANYLRVSNTELLTYLEDSSKLEDRIYSENDNFNDENLIDIDKSWEGIFYVLTGKPIAEIENASTPLSWILYGPKEIDSDQDLGYGPATYTTIEQTKEINLALQVITEESIKENYDGKKMNQDGVYPEVWEEEESMNYLIENFNLLKDFYTKAANENEAVIVFVN